MTAAIVRLICRGCREEREVPLDTVLLLVCTDDPAMTGYRFTCAECGQRQNPANAREVELLTEAGARAMRWSKRNLPSIPPAVAALPPLTLDDLIAAHFTLPAELDVLLGRAA
jgi:hypothetical protein